MTKLLNLRPVVLITVSFVIGLVISFYVVFYKTYYLLAVLPLIVLGVIIFAYYKIDGHMKKIVVSIIALFVSFTSFFVSVRSFRNAKIDDGFYKLSGRVDEVRILSSEDDKNYYSLVLSNLTIDDRAKNYKTYLYLTYSGNIEVGNKIVTFCHVKNNSDFYENKVQIHNYSNGIRYYASVEGNGVTITKGRKTVFESINHAIRKELDKGLDDSTFSVAYALMTGKTEYMNGDTLNNFRYGGVAHIFAVSGLHVSFIASTLSLILKKVRYEKTKAVFIIGVLLFYTGVCGFPVSAMRATLMYSTLLISRLLGLKYDRLSSISLSMILIILFSPFKLFTPSFQLSYAVVIALVIFTHPIKRKLSKFMPEKIAENFAFILSAQLGALPLSLYYFGYFSLFSIVYNLFLIPVVSVVFVFLFVCVIVSAIGFVKVFVPVEFTLRCIINLFDITSPERFLVFLSTFIIAIVIYWLLGVAISDIFNFKNKIKKGVCYVLTIILVSSVIIGIKISENTVRMTVIGGLTSKAVLFEGKSVVLFISGEDYYNSYKVKSLLVHRGIRNLDCLFIDSDSFVIENVQRLSDAVKIKKVIYREEAYFNRENDLYVGLGEEEFYNEGIFSFTYWGNSNIIMFGKVGVLIDDEEFIEKVPFDIDVCICDQDHDLYQREYEEVISFINNDDGYLSAEEESRVIEFKKIKAPKKIGAN